MEYEDEDKLKLKMNTESKYYHEQKKIIRRNKKPN